MNRPPEKGLYVSATDPNFRIVIEDVSAVEDDFFLVSAIDAQDANDPFGVGEEYTPDEWANLVRRYNLKKA